MEPHDRFHKIQILWSQQLRPSRSRKRSRLELQHEKSSQWVFNRGTEEGGCGFRLVTQEGQNLCTDTATEQPMFKTSSEHRTLDLANKCMTKDFLSVFHLMGQLTNTRHSDGAPDPDGSLKEVVRIRIRHYHNLYLNRPDPIGFIPLTVDTTGRLYDDFSRLFFLHDHREASVLTNELPEESDQFRFIRDECFANWKGAVGLLMAKTSVMWISISLDLSSRLFIPLSRFIRSRRHTPFLAPSLVLFPPCSSQSVNA